MNTEMTIHGHAPAGSARVQAKAHGWTAGTGTSRQPQGPFDVLASGFRVVRRMVGESSFRHVAWRYIVSAPPPLPVPASYGATFPHFIRAQGNGASFEYVADIAALEVAVGHARRAAPIRPLSQLALAALRRPCAAGLRVALHPSAGVVQSRFPIVAIWQSCSARTRTIDCWRPEAALVARPVRNVGIVCLPPGGAAFLDALKRGDTIGRAADAAAATEARFRLAPSLALLEKANVVIGLQAPA